MEDDHTTKGSTGGPATGHQDDHLMISARLIAKAVKAAMSKDTSNIDKAQLAAASAELLDAAKRYGKLEDKALGKYLAKAEAYLNHYHSSHSSTRAHGGETAHAHQGGESAGGDVHGHSATGGAYGEYIKIAQALLKSGEHGGEGAHGSGGGGGGYGDYIKIAQGLLNKKGKNGGDGAHGNYDDYIKMAQDLFNKDVHGKDGAHGDSSGGGGAHGNSSGAGDYIKMAQGLLK